MPVDLASEYRNEPCLDEAQSMENVINIMVEDGSYEISNRIKVEAGTFPISRSKLYC